MMLLMLCCPKVCSLGLRKNDSLLIGSCSLSTELELSAVPLDSFPTAQFRWSLPSRNTAAHLGCIVELYRQCLYRLSTQCSYKVSWCDCPKCESPDCLG